MSAHIRISYYVEHSYQELAQHRALLLGLLERLVTHEPQALEEGGTLRLLWNEHQQSASAAGMLTSQTDQLQTRAQPSGAVAPIADLPSGVAVAMPVVKKYEGCRLSAYPESEIGGEPLTIGWGTATYHYDTPEKAGDSISLEQADALSAGRLQRDCGLLRTLLSSRLRERLHRGEHMPSLLRAFAIHRQPPCHCSVMPLPLSTRPTIRLTRLVLTSFWVASSPRIHRAMSTAGAGLAVAWQSVASNSNRCAEACGYSIKG